MLMALMGQPTQNSKKAATLKPLHMKSITPLCLFLLFLVQQKIRVCHACRTSTSIKQATHRTSRLAMTSNGSNKSCAVVGVGVLGTSLCKQILSSPHFHNTIKSVTGITKSRDHHDKIRERVGPSTKFNLVTAEGIKEQRVKEKFDYVFFCAPPSGFVDYAAAVKEAAVELWTGPGSGGVFVFTSSGSVYGEVSGVVSESSPVVETSENPRISRLVNAEKECLKAGGCCLRLAGLYDLTRGAHNFWITSGKVVQASPDGIINLLHYEDAASACLAALQASPANIVGKIFLISDGQPLSRFDICYHALKARPFQAYKIPHFMVTENHQPEGAKGKIYDVSSSVKELNWKPKYSSFQQFMESNS